MIGSKRRFTIVVTGLFFLVSLATGCATLAGKSSQNLSNVNPIGCGVNAKTGERKHLSDEERRQLAEYYKQEWLNIY